MSIRTKTVTLRPVGADGSAVITYRLSLGRPAIVRFINVDYQNQPATTDLLIKADTSAGVTLFTATNNATDVGASGVGVPVGRPGVDEGNAATAATDGLSGGWAVSSGLYFDVAQGDGQTSGDEKIVIKLWLEQ